MARGSSLGVTSSTVSVSTEGEGVWEIVHADLPPGQDVNLSFEDSPVSVYEGHVEIDVLVRPIAAARTALVPLRLEFQACDDTSSLPLLLG